MITTPEEFVDMITVNKDRELGQWDREYMHGMILHVMESVAKMPFPKGRMEEMLDAIEKQVFPLEKTNVTVHFTIQSQSMQQYVSPYTKKYAVGKTANGIEERIIWVLRPEFVKIGYIKEITNQVGNNRSLNSDNTHEFGTCEDCFNIVALHTREYDNNNGTDFSDIHIAVLVPCGHMINAISQIYNAQQHSTSTMKNLLKEGHRLEKKFGGKKGRRLSKH